LSILRPNSIAKNGTVAALTTETVTHSVNGFYTIALTTSNTNTLGQLDVIVNASTMAMANHRYTILTAGMFDAIVTNGRLLRSTNSNVEVQVTGSNHIAADVHEFQSGVITAGDFAANAITAAALASDAITEVQSGLATTVLVTAVGVDVVSIKAKTDNLPSDPADASVIAAAFDEIKGAGWDSGSDTLKDIADSAGGSTVNVLPLSASDPQRVVGTTIRTRRFDTSPVTITIYDANNDPVDLDSFDLRVTVEDRTTNTDILNDESPTVSGANSNIVTFQPTSTTQATTGTYYWSLRAVGTGENNSVKADGKYIVEYSAGKNT